jgi:DNA-binding response OmpR family regulator
MRFATLISERSVRYRVSDALQSMGIEVLNFSAISALVAGLQEHAFAAILIEDDGARVGHWLSALQRHADEAIALIAVGTGGTAGMSRALLHGADDYVVIDDGAEPLVQRSLARVSAKLHRPQRQTWRLGPYVLDIARRVLASVDTEVRLSPRELLLARVLIENHGRLVPLDQLCEVLCARIDDAAKRAVKQHAHMLRKKCEVVAGKNARRWQLEAVYGRGYRLMF